LRNRKIILIPISDGLSVMLLCRVGEKTTGLFI